MWPCLPYNEEALVVTATNSTGKGELADKTDYLHTERKEAKGLLTDDANNN